MHMRTLSTHAACNIQYTYYQEHHGNQLNEMACNQVQFSSYQKKFLLCRDNFFEYSLWLQLSCHYSDISKFLLENFQRKFPNAKTNFDCLFVYSCSLMDLFFGKFLFFVSNLLSERRPISILKYKIKLIIIIYNTMKNNVYEELIYSMITANLKSVTPMLVTDVGDQMCW